MFDEGSGGGGYLWFLMATLPIGLLLVIIGLIASVIRRLKPKDGL
jgi:TRAP-type mannitol/chloroaromatic compound transport system permease small subunit